MNLKLTPHPLTAQIQDPHQVRNTGNTLSTKTVAFPPTNTLLMLLNMGMDLDDSPLPSRPLLYDAVLRLLADKNRPLSNSEIIHEIGLQFGIDNSKRPPKSPKDGRTDFAYQLAWIRSDLKKKDLVNLLSDGSWEISNIGILSIS